MEALTSIDQLWDAVRVSSRVAHYIFIEALLCIAIILFWLRLRQISRDLGRLRWRTHQLSRDVEDIADRWVSGPFSVEKKAKVVPPPKGRGDAAPYHWP